MYAYLTPFHPLLGILRASTALTGSGANDTIDSGRVRTPSCAASLFRVRVLGASRKAACSARLLEPENLRRNWGRTTESGAVRLHDVRTRARPYRRRLGALLQRLTHWNGANVGVWARRSRWNSTESVPAAGRVAKIGLLATVADHSTRHAFGPTFGA